MTQTIKPNDLVYIPHFSTCIFTVKHHFLNTRYVAYGNEEYYFLPSGKLDRDDVAPLVYLATPENKAKLEGFYGITLEDIPVDEEVEKFSKALYGLSKFYNRLNAFSTKVITAEEMEELESIKSNLIQMFKERGAK